MRESVDRRRRFPEPPAYANVRIELALTTFDRLLPSILGGAIWLVGSILLLAQEMHDRGLRNLALILLLSASFRAAVVAAFSYLRPAKLTPWAALRWQLLYGSITFFHCACVALGTLYVFRTRGDTAQMLLTMGVFAKCSALGSRTSSQPWVTLVCSMTMLATLAASLWMHGGAIAGAGITLICIFAYTYYQCLGDRFEMLVEQLRGRRKLRELAEQDLLTGLANRHEFHQRLTAACLEKTGLAILFVDLDRFKQVNDTFGHATGDLLLQETARRLRCAVRAEDVVARLGGDEFAILQCRMPSEEVVQVIAERINASLAMPFEINGHDICISASIGIRHSVPNEQDREHILSNADDALYRVKRAGGGSFSFVGQKG